MQLEIEGLRKMFSDMDLRKSDKRDLNDFK